MIWPPNMAGTGGVSPGGSGKERHQADQRRHSEDERADGIRLLSRVATGAAQWPVTPLGEQVPSAARDGQAKPRGPPAVEQPGGPLALGGSAGCWLLAGWRRSRLG